MASTDRNEFSSGEDDLLIEEELEARLERLSAQVDNAEMLRSWNESAPPGVVGTTIDGPVRLGSYAVWRIIDNTGEDRVVFERLGA